VHLGANLNGDCFDYRRGKGKERKWSVHVSSLSMLAHTLTAAQLSLILRAIVLVPAEIHSLRLPASRFLSFD
jgi:hypothetical protein